MTYKPKAPPAGCAAVLEHERELVTLARDLEKRGRELLTSDGRIMIATANQLLLAAIRARTAAAELAREREHRDFVKYLVAHDRQRLGIDRHAPRERPRLERIS